MHACAACRESKTKQYDAEAMRYLSYALFPLVAAYSVYTLLYQTHRSWYSWVLNTLVGAVYTFGFVLMVRPQLGHQCSPHHQGMRGDLWDSPLAVHDLPMAVPCMT